MTNNFYDKHDDKNVLYLHSYSLEHQPQPSLKRLVSVSCSILEILICDAKEGGGGSKISVKMTLKVNEVICEQPLNH